MIQRRFGRGRRGFDLVFEGEVVSAVEPRRDLGWCGRCSTPCGRLVLASVDRELVGAHPAEAGMWPDGVVIGAILQDDAG